MVTTLDTMSQCPGVFTNAKKLAKAGVSLLYGAEIAHGDIPWGIDAQNCGSSGMSQERPRSRCYALLHLKQARS